MHSQEKLTIQLLAFHLVLALDGIRVRALAVGEDATSNKTLSNGDRPFSRYS
jgi:hypothetical protein